MVTFRDYDGFYQEPLPHYWFIMFRLDQYFVLHLNFCFFSFRDIFFVQDDCLIAAKFLSHSPNSVLRVINNDNHEELPLVFNRLAPGILHKNKVKSFIPLVNH